MTFAVINWLNISINLLLVVFVIICVLMTLLILMQRPKQEGLGAAFGGGVTDQVFGARTTNVLQRGTVYLGSLFFILALVLAVLIGQKNKTVKTVTAADIAAKAEAAKIAEKPAVITPPSLTGELPAVTPTPVPADPSLMAPVEIQPTPPVDPAAPTPPSAITVDPAPVVPPTPVVPEDPAPPAVPADPTPADKPKEG